MVRHLSLLLYDTSMVAGIGGDCGKMNNQVVHSRLVQSQAMVSLAITITKEVVYDKQTVCCVCLGGAGV